MQTVRRLYVYLMSGISLGVLAVGLSMLVTVLFDRLGLGPTGDVLFGRDESIRQQLTLASAMTAVSLPVWLIHWFLAERSVTPGRPGSDEERSSAVRGLFFAVAFAALLLFAALSAIDLVQSFILRITGDQSFDFRNPAAALATLLVTLVAWAYHVSLRARDWRRGPMVRAGAWLPRLYLYLATFGGLLLLLFGITGLVELVGRLVLDEPGAIGFEGGPWWAYPLADAVSRVLVGGSIWLGHWAYANRLQADAGWRGSSERPARLRLAFYVAVLAAAAIFVANFLVEGSRNGLLVLLGASEASSAGQVGASIVLPLVSAMPFGLAWWIHLGWMHAEAAASDDPGRPATADRLDLHAVAVVGLAFAAIGLGWMIGLLIDVLLGGNRTLGDAIFWQAEIAQFVPMTVIGSALWIWKWRRIMAAAAADPVAEAGSTARRAALLFVLAASILSGIGSLGVILYLVFGSIFGIDLPGNLVSELSTPLGALIVAAASAVYHGMVLRRDQALRADARPAEAETAVAEAPPFTIALRLSAPRDADPSVVLAELRAGLPPGYTLELLPSKDAG